jgi:hypothetical protein
MTCMSATPATQCLFVSRKRTREKLTNGGWQGWHSSTASKQNGTGLL